MPPSSRRLIFRRQELPIRGGFRISRETRRIAQSLIVEIAEGGHTGRGECTPYPRYGESVDSVIAQIESRRKEVEAGLDRERLQTRLPPGAARNALDCALWDLEAKQSAAPVWRRAGLPEPRMLTTAVTVSIDAPNAMAARAAGLKAPVVKMKLAGDGADPDRVRAVAEAAPASRLILDANEAFAPAQFERFLAALPQADAVALIEQPLPAAADEALEFMTCPVPICADESLHTRADLDRLARRYQVINVKLDKTGGLTEAIALVEAARARGLKIMVGCMLASSLSMAPAFLIAQQADFVDLDGPLLLDRDVENGIQFDGARMHPPALSLWG
ncbi:MAG: dipeptide epimerase [Parvularculaceae bacterium]